MNLLAKKDIDELIARYPELESCKADILRAAEIMVDCFKRKGKLLVCGNGGSAADCEHIVGELMKSFRLKRELSTERQETIRSLFPAEADVLINHLQEALPAISLVSQTAFMTAFANDVSAELLFAQQVLGYGKPGDILMALSTSGNSANVLYAARIAKVKKMMVIGLTNENGGILTELSDVVVRVPKTLTYEVQELHLPIYHYLCAYVEDSLFR